MTDVASGENEERAARSTGTRAATGLRKGLTKWIAGAIILILVVWGIMWVKDLFGGGGEKSSFPAIGQWSEPVRLNGCTVTFLEGHGKWYEIRYRIFGNSWSNHVTDRVSPMNEFQYKLLRADAQALPYSFSC